MLNANPNILISSLKRDSADFLTVTTTERIIEFYDEATADYEHWSKKFNMHFGFYRRGLNFLRREEMLEQMNLEIAGRLQIDAVNKAFLIDLGCGTGAVSRTIAKIFPNADIKGITISPSQSAMANRLNAAENLTDQIEIIKDDYTKLPFADATADGVWAVESACYADGADKANLIDEMARVLKKGGRFAVADCFVKQPEKAFSPLIKKCYRTVCDSWALTEMSALDDFTTALKNSGFREIVVEDISWRIVPSLVHAPFSVIGFSFKKMLAGERLKPQSVNNLKASLLAAILGLNRAKFSYCLISGSRR